jgi:pSer/pThr/pTyr-binding forkhead associated (FHA) protein
LTLLRTVNTISAAQYCFKAIVGVLNAHTAAGFPEGVAMASIIVMSGTQKGDYYPLGQRPNVVGRDEAVPIQILDEHISRKHMQIRFDKDKGQYYALDMKSKHGVFINGGRIHDETVLVDDDQIHIGRTDLLFTEKDFTDRESALSHFKKVGERMRATIIE